MHYLSIGYPEQAALYSGLDIGESSLAAARAACCWERSKSRENAGCRPRILCADFRCPLEPHSGTLFEVGSFLCSSKKGIRHKWRFVFTRRYPAFEVAIALESLEHLKDHPEAPEVVIGAGVTFSDCSPNRKNL